MLKYSDFSLRVCVCVRARIADGFRPQHCFPDSPSFGIPTVSANKKKICLTTDLIIITKAVARFCHRLLGKVKLIRK